MVRSSKAFGRSRLDRRPRLEALEERIQMSGAAGAATAFPPPPPLPTSGVINGWVFKLVSQSNTPAPGAEAGTLTGGSIQPGRISDHAQVIFSQTVNNAAGAAAGEGLFITRYNPRTTASALQQPRLPITQIVRSGEKLIGGTVATAGTTGVSAVNAQGNASFAVALTPAAGSPTGVAGGVYQYIGNRNLISALAVTGDKLPGGSTFQTVNSHVGLTNSGQTYFSALVALPPNVPGSPAVTGLNGATEASGVYQVGGMKNLVKVAAPGDLAPDGAALDYAADPSINDVGSVAYIGHETNQPTTGLIDPTGNLTVNGVAINTKLLGGTLFFARPNFPASVIAKPGDHVKNLVTGGTDTLLYAADPVANNKGQVLFLGAIQGTNGGVGGSPSLGVYQFSPQSGLTRIVGPGDVLPNNEVFTTAKAGFGSIDLNDRGDVSFLANTNKGQGVYLDKAGVNYLVAHTGDVIPALGLGPITNFNQGNNRAGGPFINSDHQFVFSANTAQGDALFTATAYKTITYRANHKKK